MEYRIAEIELVYKPNKMVGVKIDSSEDVYKLMIQNWDSNRISLVEEFKILLLNRANHVLGIHTLSKGGLHGTIVDIKLLMGIVVKSAASGIILVHNHPSGQLIPSQSDRKVTYKIKDACELMDVKLLDHIIISPGSHLSFSDKGLL